MADTKISALTELPGASVVSGDKIPIVDTSTATTKKLDANEVCDMPLITDSNSWIVATSINGALQELASGALTVNTVSSTGSTETLTLAAVQRMTMDQNCTFTFPTPAGTGHGFLLILSGAFTPTFPGSVDWSGGAPTYATPSWYTFVTWDSGSTWYGTLIGSGFA